MNTASYFEEEVKERKARNPGDDEGV